MVHWKHGVIPGRMTRAWPLKPSVPPSTTGLMVLGSGLPSSLCARWGRKPDPGCVGFRVYDLQGSWGTIRV
jgi:hypothetical protein